MPDIQEFYTLLGMAIDWLDTDINIYGMHVSWFGFSVFCAFVTLLIDLVYEYLGYEWRY